MTRASDRITQGNPCRLADAAAVMTVTWPEADHGFPVERLDAFLAWAADQGASDIAFQTGEVAMMEIDGRLLDATRARLDGVALSALAQHVFGPAAEGFLRAGKTLDCSHAIGRDASLRRRFRCNLTAVQVADGFGINLTLRVLPDAVPTFDELAIEPVIRDAWARARGLTLVTGVPGSGKSTLLAAGIRHLLEAGQGRVHSYEAPIEFTFDRIARPGAMMSSSEVPRHVESFAAGLRASLRRRPRAVVVGEARDHETVEAVVRAADTGIAVYATAHTIGVAATIRRLVAEFLPDERAERAVSLVDVLHLVVTQVLVPRIGGGRQALRECLVFDRALKVRLTTSPPPLWPAIIEEEIETRASSLAASARRALRRGLISAGDHGRICRTTPLSGGES